MPDRDEHHDDLEPIRRLPIVREIGVELRGLAAEEDARAAGRSRRRPFTVLADAGGRALPTRPGRRVAGGLAATVAGAALVAGVVVAVRDADPPLPTSTSVAVGSGVAPSKLQLRFAVFRETDAPTTAVPDAPDPGTMLRQFANGAIAGLEVDRAGARVLSVPDAVVVVAPARTATGAEQVCMVVSNRYKGGGTSADCAPTAKVLADGLFSVSDIDAAVARAAELDPDTRVVDGLVPDGATAVRIETADGDLIDAPVSDNAISVSVTGEPVRATFRDRSGTNRKADL